jgi:hypothetical protein
MIKLSARTVQVALGLLWLLDGALQLQHQMFSSAFASQVIAAATRGQPALVSGPMNFGMHLFLLHPAIFNTLFALTQLGIGALILWKRTLKLGLILSVCWGLIVWIFGEGYGGIFSAHTLLLMGAPGAVSLYVLLSLAVMPKRGKDKQKPQVAYWLALVWLVVWIGGGIYQLLPGQDSTSYLSSMIASNAQGAPGWLASTDTKAANFVQGLGKEFGQSSAVPIANMNMTSAQMTHMSNEPYTPARSDPGYWFILLLAVLMFAIGLGVLFSGLWRNLAISLGILLALTFWIIGQSLGGYYTGLATDPNSGPLFMLLGLAILGCANLDQRLSALGQKIEGIMIGRPNNDPNAEAIMKRSTDI